MLALASECNRLYTRAYTYRPIALAPTLSKTIEWSILIDNRSVFATSTLQFGFKQGFST